MGILTCTSLEDIYLFDTADDNIEMKNYLSDASNFVSFSDELIKEITIKAPDADEREKQLDYCMKKSKEYGIDIERNTINNWLSSKTNPQGNQASRDNIYKLCFLLEFNDTKTAEFFSKVYMDRPFDFRQKNEVIYYFCLKNQLNYQTAVSLIKQTDDINNTNSENPILTRTNVIGEDVSTIKEVDKFISYLKSNSQNFSVSNYSSTNAIKKLIEDCREIVSKQTNTDKSFISNDKILYEIYGGNTAITRKPKGEPKVIKKTIKANSAFLEVVKMSFPQKQQLYQVLKGGNTSYYTIRKILILLNFYVFFNQKNNVTDCDTFDWYVQVSNDILTSCGYNGLYPCNPYDWMFLYCAFQEDPIGQFQALMELMYFSEAYEDSE